MRQEKKKKKTNISSLSHTPDFSNIPFHEFKNRSSFSDQYKLNVHVKIS